MRLRQQAYFREATTQARQVSLQCKRQVFVLSFRDYPLKAPPKLF